MFNIRDNVEIKKEIVDQSEIFIIDDFYKEPDSIVNYLLSTEPPLRRGGGYNNIHFEDRQHGLLNPNLEKVYLFLRNICGHESYLTDKLITNFTRLKENQFNDYKNNYWLPHRDMGYTALVYLNKNDINSGTNLYQSLDPDNEPPNFGMEYSRPWRIKDKYKVLKHIEPKYNRMVLYNGLKFLHGMNICNDDYFGDEYRMNQVFFFVHPPFSPVSPDRHLRSMIKVLKKNFWRS